MHGHVGKEGVVLEHHPDVAPMGRDVVDRAPVEEDIAVGRGLEPREHHEAGGLPRTGGAQHGEELAPVDFEVEVLDDEGLAVVALLDVREPDEGFLRGRGAHAAPAVPGPPGDRRERRRAARGPGLAFGPDAEPAARFESDRADEGAGVNPGTPSQGSPGPGSAAPPRTRCPPGSGVGEYLPREFAHHAGPLRASAPPPVERERAHLVRGVFQPFRPGYANPPAPFLLRRIVRKRTIAMSFACCSSRIGQAEARPIAASVREPQRLRNVRTCVGCEGRSSHWSPTGVRAVHTASGPGGRRRKGLEPSRRLSETTDPRSPSAFRVVFPATEVTKCGARCKRAAAFFTHRAPELVHRSVRYLGAQVLSHMFLRAVRRGPSLAAAWAQPGGTAFGGALREPLAVARPPHLWVSIGHPGVLLSGSDIRTADARPAMGRQDVRVSVPVSPSGDDP